MYVYKFCVRILMSNTSGRSTKCKLSAIGRAIHSTPNVSGCVVRVGISAMGQATNVILETPGIEDESEKALISG